jgi:hypothetical protein
MKSLLNQKINKLYKFNSSSKIYTSPTSNKDDHETIACDNCEEDGCSNIKAVTPRSSQEYRFQATELLFVVMLPNEISRHDINLLKSNGNYMYQLL